MPKLIVLLPHPVTPEQKARAKLANVRIIDEIWKDRIDPALLADPGVLEQSEPRAPVPQADAKPPSRAKAAKEPQAEGEPAPKPRARRGRPKAAPKAE